MEGVVANCLYPKFFAGRRVMMMMGFLLFSPFGCCPLSPTPHSRCLTTYCFLLRAVYSDGKIKGPPKPCAGNQGTQITVGFCAFSLLPLFCSLVVTLAPLIGTCYIVRCVTVSPCRMLSKLCWFVWFFCYVFFSKDR